MLPSKGKKIKETVVLNLLHISMPSVDEYSDLAMIVRFYIGSQTNLNCDEKYM